MPQYLFFPKIQQKFEFRLSKLRGVSDVCDYRAEIYASVREISHGVFLLFFEARGMKVLFEVRILEGNDLRGCVVPLYWREANRAT